MNEQSVITSIEKQKSRKRYNIYINDEFAFSVHEDILIKYRLIKGKSIEPAEWTEILTAEEKNRIRHYAYSYLSHSPRTETEVLNYLVNKGFKEVDCREVVEACIKDGYINDKVYSGGWIDSRKRSRPRGKKLIKMELLNKGIDESIIDEQLGERLSREDEEEMMILLIEKKLKNMKFETSFEMKKKIVPYLQRKGFNLDQIMSIIDKLKSNYLL